MKYQLNITDHFGSVNLYLKEDLTEDLKKAIQSLDCVEKLKTSECNPCFLQVYKTKTSSLENLAFQIYKLSLTI